MASPWDVIEAAALSLGIAAETVRKWRVRGVPGRYRLPITRLAEKQGRPVDENAFDQPPGPRRGRLHAAAPANPSKSDRMPGRRNPGDSTVTPEDSIRAREPRPFTGAEYVESLRDGREVYIDGERVTDVTAHPAFRNSVRSLARLYDALHDDRTKEVLTSPTDTGSGGYTHKYFRVARSRDELVAQQRAIACWSRLTYGWMGRTPDYKASLMNTLGANAEYYGQFAANARRWYRRAQENVLFMNHAIVNPPVDRGRPTSEVKDVYVTIERETDAGIVVSGAKVVATAAAITHYNFLGQNAATATSDPDLAVMFILPMDAPGVKLICRNSYERIANTVGSPYDYPLSSRFDENDAIFILDKVLIPWEDVLVHRDPEKILSFYPRSGFLNGFCFQGCTRFAVKLDFICGLVARALHATGGDEFRGNQAMLGEIVSWRNLFWSLSDCMASNPQPWVGDALLPNLQAGLSYRVFAPDAYSKIKEIIEKIVASALIYLPSSVKDFANPAIDPYLKRYVRGSNGIGYRERIKLMKLLWDAIGTEFGGRHELYERNYAGNHEDIRIQALTGARRNGTMDRMTDLVDQCMAEYDEHGWTGDTVAQLVGLSRTVLPAVSVAGLDSWAFSPRT
jgi:4-hydroxyphenylacetate 3-monooxygenase